MKIEPTGRAENPSGARVTFTRGDVLKFARLLSFARRGGFECSEREGKATELMLERLAGMCEGLDSNAEVYLDEVGEAYTETRKIFDPGYPSG